MARRRPGTHNARRRFVESHVLRVLVGRVPGQARPERRRRGGRRPDRRGAEGSGPAAAPGARGQRCPRPDVAAPVAPRVPARSPRRPGAAGGRRQGDPQLRSTCSGCTGPAAPRSRPCRGRWATPRSSTRRAPCSAPAGAVRPGCGPSGAEEGTASEIGILAAGPGGLAGAGGQRGDRVRGRHPRLRPHRRGRGAGPLADAAAHAGPPLAVGLHDGRGRHRAGHRAVGPGGMGRHHAAI